MVQGSEVLSGFNAQWVGRFSDQLDSLTQHHDRSSWKIVGALNPAPATLHILSRKPYRHQTPNALSKLQPTPETLTLLMVVGHIENVPVRA